MPTASITFRVPQDFAALQSAIADHPGECDRIDYDDLDNLDRQLRDLIGETIEIDFDEPHDPSEPVAAFVRALSAGQEPYLAVHQSYAEPSRGVRFQARILVRTPEFQAERQYPWVEGEPEISGRAAFRTAGFSEDEIRSIDAAFFPASSPKP
jgi:hypothetical protein